MMNLAKRKPNRLKKYDYSQNGAYFVTICTRGRKKVLSHISVGVDAHIDPQISLTQIGEIVKKCLLKIDGIEKYIIMPDHIHMIISIEGNDGAMKASPPTKPISQHIKSFKIMVTKELGYSLFQRSYFDHIIRNRQDYEEIWKYIDENPVRWMNL